MIIDQLFTHKKLYEFAPSDDGDGPDQEEMLRRMASHWWNGTERQMAKVENTLAALGWEIGEDDGYDDGGVFVVRAGDEHGRSYISWPHEDLEINKGMDEGRKRTKKKTSRSLGRYFFPGYGYYGSGDAGEGGGDGGGGESANPADKLKIREQGELEVLRPADKSDNYDSVRFRIDGKPVEHGSEEFDYYYKLVFKKDPPEKPDPFVDTLKGMMSKDPGSMGADPYKDSENDVQDGDVIIPAHEKGHWVRVSDMVEAGVADPSRRRFLKKAAGAAAAGVAMSAAGPEIVTLVKGFAEQAGGMNGIQALKAMLKIATPDELYNMYDYYADSGILEDAITESDMIALDRAGYDNWSEFEEHCDENGVDPDDEFKRLTGQPLKVSRVDDILGQVDDTWSLEDFFDQYPEAMNIINPPRESLLSMRQLANIDTAAKGANLPTPIVAMANAVAGLVRQIFKSNGQQLAAPQKVAQTSRAAPALPAPTRPEFDMTPDLKQKEKVPVQRKGDDEEPEDPSLAPADPRKTIQLLVDVGALSRGVLTDKSGMITKEKAQELLNKYYDGNQDMAEGEVVAFSKNKIKPPHDITGDDVEYAWALKHRAGAKDKISYQHNGVTLHHPDGSSTFILGGHRSLFDRDHAGKLKFKSDLSAANRSFKMPTRSAIKNNIVDFKAKESQGVTEGEYDSRKPFGVRYKVFAGREGRMTTREYWTSSEEKLQRAVDKIQALNNFYEIDGYSYPKESQGVAEGEYQDDYEDSPDQEEKIANFQKIGQPMNAVVGSQRTTTDTGNSNPEFQERIASVTGPNGQGMYKVTVINNNDIASSYLTKNPPRNPQFFRKDVNEMFADQGSGSTDRDNADYMKRRNAAKKAGYTGRETKAGTWRVFKDGNAVAAAGPFKSADEAAAWIKKHKQGITEMDKSEPSAGRDTGPRPGPDREAKPITAKKATRDAGRMLNRAFQDSHKKKDVSEAYPLGYSTDPAQGKWYREGMDAVKYGTVGDSIKEIAKKHYVPPQWLEAFTAGFRQQEEWSRQGAARGFPGGRKPEPYTKSKAMPVPPTFPANTRGGGGAANLPDRLPGEHDTQLPYRRGMDTKPQIQQIVPSMIKEKSINPLMLKLRRAMVREGRVKELADDLKTMPDADFMKKYGKAKAAIRADMKRVDEAGISRLDKKDIKPEFDFRKGLGGDDETGYETENEPELGTFRMGKPVEPNDAATQAFMAAFQGAGAEDNRFTAPSGWRYVEKGEDPARYGSEPAAATSALPNLKYDPQSRTLKPADALALDLSPKSKFKFDRTTQQQVPADGSSANPNIDAATRDRARAYAAKQNAPVDAAKKKTDWKTIYALNKATIGSNPNLIRPGMKLKMPDGSTYPVQPGDNLTKIAAKQSQINELSTEKLAQYKTAAARDARQADQEGDVKRGDKRFGGIVKATKKQFDNDAKKVDESRAARRALMARIVNSG